MNKLKKWAIGMALPPLLMSPFAALAKNGDIVGKRPGVILYKLKENLGPREQDKFEQVLADYGIVQQLGLKSGARNEVFSEIKLPERSLSAKSDSGDSYEEGFTEALRETGAVEFAGPDYLIEGPELGDEQASSFQDNDSLVDKQWYRRKLLADEAIDLAGLGEEVVVGVCDSGVDGNHPDLKNRLLPGYNSADGSTNSSPATNHGTAVTGVIAAEVDNGIGIAGLAPMSKVIPIRITNSSQGTAYISSMARCIKYAADRGARVINLSFSGAGNSAINSAAKYARSKNSLLFMAAGNSGRNISRSVSNYSSFMLVSSTTSSDKLSSFSNYGTPVDIAAPGSGIYTTYRNSKYGSINGTSFASPIAAAVAAHVLSINPALDVDQLEQVVRDSATNIGSNNLFGSGRVNLKQAITSALELGGNALPRIKVKDFSPNVLDQPLVVDANESYDPEGDSFGYTWSLNDVEISNGPVFYAEASSLIEGESTLGLTLTDSEGRNVSKTWSVFSYGTEGRVVSNKKVGMRLFYSKSSSSARASITLLDQLGEPVEGAVVTGQWNQGSEVQGTTNAQGKIEFKSPSRSKKYLHKFKVQNVSGDSLTFDPERFGDDYGSIRFRSFWDRLFGR